MAQERTRAQLGNIPMILEILVTRGQLHVDEQAEIVKIMNTLRENNPSGTPIPEDWQKYKGKFAGEIFVARCKERDGDAAEANAKAQVDDVLRYQSQLIAKAAVDDLSSIITGNPLEFPRYLALPHWGNNGEANAVSDPITIDNAAVSAANIGKLLVILTKNNREMALAVQDGVVAAKMLTDFILEGNTATHPASKISEWEASAKFALEKAATLDNVKPQTVANYINNRFQEIAEGLQLALEKSQDTSKKR